MNLDLSDQQNPILAEFLLLGLAGIFLLDHNFAESDAGCGRQTRTETIVARKGDSFVKISASEHQTFGFGSKRRFGITSEAQITEAEYLEMSHGKTLVDTPEEIEKVNAHKTFLLRRSDAEDKLNSIKYDCPDCKGPMHWMSGKHGPFWSCNKYPN